jgi:hypothetical protein
LPSRQSPEAQEEEELQEPPSKLPWVTAFAVVAMHKATAIIFIIMLDSKTCSKGVVWGGVWLDTKRRRTKNKRGRPEGTVQGPEREGTVCV